MGCADFCKVLTYNGNERNLIGRSKNIKLLFLKPIFIAVGKLLLKCSFSLDLPLSKANFAQPLCHLPWSSFSPMLPNTVLTQNLARYGRSKIRTHNHVVGYLV